MPRPNVVFIMTDHTRAAALRDAQCQTPCLQALSRQGVRFERAYTTNAICSPARASLMTGLYASTHGVWDCTHTQRREWVDVRNNPLFWSQVLQRAGYANGYFGKWHVEQSNRLEDFGFPTHDQPCGHYRTAVMDRPRMMAVTPGYKDHLMAAVDADRDTPPRHPAFEKGLAFIREQAAKGQSFCCFISTSEPHDPYVPPKSFLDRYDIPAMALSPTLHEDLSGKPAVVQRMAAIWRYLTDDDWRFVTAAYDAVISFLDHEVGRVVEELARLGLADNTVVVFCSDHGDMLGGHGLFAKGTTPYEEVYNIPLIFRVPGASPRVDREHLVSLVDVAATILDLCGLGTMPGCQGRSLRAVLQGAANPADWQDAYAEFYGQRFVYTQRIVWHGDWKYVFSPGGIDELYHLADDPHEQRNLAAEPSCRGRLTEMTKRMWRKMEQIGDSSLLDSHYKTLRIAPVGPLE